MRKSKSRLGWLELVCDGDGYALATHPCLALLRRNTFPERGRGTADLGRCRNKTGISKSKICKELCITSVLVFVAVVVTVVVSKGVAALPGEGPCLAGLVKWSLVLMARSGGGSKLLT